MTVLVRGFKYLILVAGSLFISFAAFGKKPIWHGLVGGSYIFEKHFNSSLHGFEINVYRHYSSCLSSSYINSFGVNYLFNGNYNELGLSYSNRLFQSKVFTKGHGGLNLFYKINPNIIHDNNEKNYLLKPGIGTTIYSGSRLNSLTVQFFALYNYNLYIKKRKNITTQENHSFQFGVFIGFDAFEIRPWRHRQKKSFEEEV